MSTIIKVRCTDQVLTFENTPVIASGGLEEDFVSFAFCSKWDGLVKTAVFWRSEEEVYHVLLDEVDSCPIPREVLAVEGVIYFGVFGVSEAGKQRTSEVLRYNIAKGAITEGTKPTDPTPDIYTQILQEYAELRTVKADKVKDATPGNFAGLDVEGNLVDSGKNADSFVHIDTGDAEPEEGSGPVVWVEPTDSERSLEDVTTKEGLMLYRNAAGQVFAVMPITRADLIEGLDVFIAEQIAGQGETLLTHLDDFDNPHKVTADQVGAVSTASVGKPGGVAGLDESGAVPVSQGGTGATDAAGAVVSLGLEPVIRRVASKGKDSAFQKLMTGRFI